MNPPGPSFIANETVDYFEYKGHKLGGNGILGRITGVAGKALGYTVGPFLAQGPAGQYATEFTAQALGAGAQVAAGAAINYFAPPRQQADAEQLMKIIQEQNEKIALLLQTRAPLPQTVAVAA